MSDETDATEATESKESEPELKFSREHYERLMSGQKAWFQFRETREGVDNVHKAFRVQDPGGAASAIANNIEAWNANPPRPALLEGADLRGANLEGATLAGARRSRGRIARFEPRRKAVL